MRIALLILGTLGLSGQALLEDFSQGIRNNHDSPPSALWLAYSGETTGQTLALDNGRLKLVAPPSGSTCAGTECGLYLYFFTHPYNSTNFPFGWTQGYLLNGSWDTAYDRLQFEVTCDHNITRRSDGGDILELGTFLVNHSNTNPDNTDVHYYHLFDMNLYANVKSTMVISAHPQHQRGFDANTNWPNEPSLNGSDGANVGYMDGLISWYWASEGTNTGQWMGVTCWFDNYNISKQSNAPDEWVSTLTGTYNGSAYEITWDGPKNATASAELRYSSASMRTNGWSTGTSAGSASTPGSAFTGVLKTVSIAQSATEYFAIRPTMLVSGAATSGGKTEITTYVGHALTTGDQVTVASIGGCTSANSTDTVTVVDRLNFTLNSSTGCNSAYTSGGTVLATSDTTNFVEFSITSATGGSTHGGNGNHGGKHSVQ